MEENQTCPIPRVGIEDIRNPSRIRSVKKLLRQEFLPHVIVLLLTALCIVAALLINDVVTQQHVYVNYNPSRDSAPLPPPASRRHAPSAYEPYCDAPTNREDSDLCAQWGAVAAVTESNQIARLTLWLSLISIFATGVGAVLVMRSLQQADKAYLFARQSMQVELRAYISVNHHQVDVVKGNFGNILGYRFTTVWINTGSTPAVLASAASSFFFQYGGMVPAWKHLRFDSLDDHSSRSTIGAGQEMRTSLTISLNDIVKVDSGQDLYVWASCEYQDAFNKNTIHRTEVCSKFAFDGLAAHGTENLTGGHSGPFNGIDDTAFLEPRRAT